MRLFFLLFLTGTLLASDLSKELYAKPTLSQRQIEDKTDGIYVTGLPLINYDADKGVGYGARVYLYNNGHKGDELFSLTPYKTQLYLQVFQTTNGWSYHTLHYDAPYINDSLFRLTTHFAYEKNTQATYFGTTADSLKPLSDPNGNTYSSADTQEETLKNEGSQYYNRFLLVRPAADINLARDFFGGLVRVSMGIYLSKTTIRDYNDTTVLDQHNDRSKLADDKETLTGYDGGWDNGVRIGLVYDSRDFAPNPKHGSIQDVTAEFFGTLTGSDYTHQRYTFSTRNFYTPNSFDFFTLAIRGIYSVQNGDTPFYNKNILSFADKETTGLGGFRSLRGYQQDRFVANVKVLGNLETRFNFYEAHTFGQSFEFMVVPFVDAGKVFDHVEDTDLKDYKYTVGSGLRIVWNQATVMMMDYGQSSEGSGLYINFGHIF